MVVLLSCFVFVVVVVGLVGFDFLVFVVFMAGWGGCSTEILGFFCVCGGVARQGFCVFCCVYGWLGRLLDRDFVFLLCLWWGCSTEILCFCCVYGWLGPQRFCLFALFVVGGGAGWSAVVAVGVLVARGSVGTTVSLWRIA